MTVVVRQAAAKDMESAVPLLLDAAENLLTCIFGNGNRDDAFAFLSAAWLRGTGQYGFENHWLACVGEDIVGIASCWHDGLPEHFDRNTLAAITDYFGIDEALEVVMRSQQHTIALHCPLVLEMSVGHIAVAAGARRNGVGTALIRFMERKARALGKLSLILDVEEHNHGAVRFYEALGFSGQQIIAPFIKMSKGIAPL